MKNSILHHTEITPIGTSISFSLVNYYAFYFREKAKTDAQRDSIKEITNIIETEKKIFIEQLEVFKSNLSQDIEKLKAELQIIIRKEQMLLDEERNIVLKFYETLTSFFYKIGLGITYYTTNGCDFDMM